jgi:hypothetical protein
MVFDMAFNNEQIKFLNQIGLSIDFSKDLSDADYEKIEEVVSAHLQKNGFDKQYKPTEEGKMCESILDIL